MIDIDQSTAFAAQLATQLKHEVDLMHPGDGPLERAQRMATAFTVLAMLNAEGMLAVSPTEGAALEACDRIAAIAKLAIETGNVGWDGIS